MTTNELYENLYAKAIAFILPAMEKLYGTPSGAPGWVNADEKTRLTNGIKAWTLLVEELRPPATIDLDHEAIEAIKRSYSK